MDCQLTYVSGHVGYSLGESLLVLTPKTYYNVSDNSVQRSHGDLKSSITKGDESKKV